MMMSSHHRLSGSLILDEKSMAWLVNCNFTGLLKSGFQGKTKRSYNLTAEGLRRSYNGSGLIFSLRSFQTSSPLLISHLLYADVLHICVL